MLLDEVGVNVPRVPVLGLVHKGLQQVAARLSVGRGSRRAFALHRQRQRFGVAALVEEAGDAARLGINGEADEFVLKESAVASRASFRFRRRAELLALGTTVNELIASSWHILDASIRTFTPVAGSKA